VLSGEAANTTLKMWSDPTGDLSKLRFWNNLNQARSKSKYWNAE